jgi:hypothetical protein
MHSFLFKFTLVLSSVLLFWKLLVFEFLLCISETLHCSVSAHVQLVPLLDMHRLVMLFAGTLTYSEPRAFPLIIFYNTSYKCYYYYYYYYYYYMYIRMYIL